MTTIKISAYDLWTGEHDARRPVRDLDDDENSHIHGRLEIIVGGRTLPWLGYFGPDDVCLNTWVEEFVRIQRSLTHDGAEYVFDEGEQGQPAFGFRRTGEVVEISIRDSALSGGGADPDWQAVPCDALEFFAEVEALLTRIEAEVVAVGEVGVRWWAAATRS